jgi:hypothetical protein
LLNLTDTTEKGRQTRGLSPLATRARLSGFPRVEMLDFENSAEYLGNISPGYFGGRARSRLRAAFAGLQTGITADVYIDGFNLYYRALRKTPYNWLNLRRLCEFLLPGNLSPKSNTTRRW